MSQNRQRQQGPGMGPRGGRTFEKPKDFKKTFGKLKKYLKPYYFTIFIAGLMAIIGSLLGVIAPYLLGKITTMLYNAYKAADGGPIVLSSIHIFFGIRLSLIELSVFIIGVHLLSSLFNYLQSYLLIGMTQNLSYGMRKDLSQKINKLPLSYFDKEEFGDILGKVTNDVETINQTLNQSLAEIFRSIAVFIGIMVIMFILSPLMASVVVVTTIISLFVSRFFVKKSQGFFRAQAKSNGQMTGHIEENYSGHTIVKVFNHQEVAYQEFSEINNKLYETSVKSQFISGIMMPVQFFIGNIAYIAIIALGAVLASQPETSAIFIEIGLIQTFIQYTRQINQPIQQIGSIAYILQSTAAAAERVFSLLDQEEESKERENLVTLNDCKGHVEFENVQFSYVENIEVIKNFTAEIKPGQMVAIVGPTGAGKTTIVNLLMRFYEINSGSIKVDGVDIRDMSRSDVRNLFGMVLQDTWLFEGTILENIRYGSNKPLEDVYKAAKSSQVDHFIQSLSLGYDFVLSEGGSNISQGQRQLLTICRAMVSDNPMLILDEATSSVDTRTEVLIQKAMDALMKDRTSFVIAHRLSTIKDADVIFVMDKGNIVETGNHETLLKQNGFYAKLYYSQFDVK